MTRKSRQAGSQLQNEVLLKFLVTNIFSFLFFGVIGSVWLRQLNFSRHYFVFLFLLIFFLTLYLLYYVQDSCEKWQENKGKQGVISRTNNCKIFLSLSFSSSIFSGMIGSVQRRQLAISRHCFVFSILSFFGVTRSVRQR